MLLWGGVTSTVEKHSVLSDVSGKCGPDVFEHICADNELKRFEKHSSKREQIDSLSYDNFNIFYLFILTSNSLIKDFLCGELNRNGVPNQH